MKTRMKVEAAMNAVVAIGLAIAISGCGGGGGGSNTVSTNQQYLSSASVGEVLTYNLDTTALTYSYTITKKFLYFIYIEHFFIFNSFNITM